MSVASDDGRPAGSLQPLPTTTPSSVLATIYVYFKTPRDRRDAVRSALRSQVADLTRPPAPEQAPVASSADASMRAEDHSGELTWLECYRGVPLAALDAALESIAAGARRHGLESHALAGRHIEVFIPI